MLCNSPLIILMKKKEENLTLLFLLVELHQHFNYRVLVILVGLRI